MDKNKFLEIGKKRGTPTVDDSKVNYLLEVIFNRKDNNEIDFYSFSMADLNDVDSYFFDAYDSEDGEEYICNQEVSKLEQIEELDLAIYNFHRGEKRRGKSPFPFI